MLDGVHLTKKGSAADQPGIWWPAVPLITPAWWASTSWKKLARIPVEADLASEFRYRDPIVDEHTLVIIVSQSGETADTLPPPGKRRGARVLSIVNVVGSTIASESDDVLYTWAGPEISVATTKAYSTQLTILYLLAFLLCPSFWGISTTVTCAACSAH